MGNGGDITGPEHDCTITILAVTSALFPRKSIIYTPDLSLLDFLHLLHNTPTSGTFPALTQKTIPHHVNSKSMGRYPSTQKKAQGIPLHHESLQCLG